MARPRRNGTLDHAPAYDDAAPRLCDHPDCREAGEYRAPRARDPAMGHYWFCLSHVRLYNAAWDFFAGMSQAEIEAYQRGNSTWHRPTWRLGAVGSEPVAGGEWFDPFDFMAEIGIRPGPRPGEPAPKPVAPAEREALADLDLAPIVTLQDIKARYKQLVKRYHPDANGGDKSAEERLKRINQAYTFLMSCGYT
ncbi:MAG TPA: J domain-containing protein [Candidatus Cybelea sp.]|nr:J domain-containing protein [Candidatus Cybelea sp.]